MENLKTPVLVAGFGTYPDGTIFVIIKDKVAKNAMLRLVKATKTATVPLAKGVTMDEAKQQFPIGKDVSTDVAFGDPIESEFGGLFAAVEPQ